MNRIHDIVRQRLRAQNINRQFTVPSHIKAEALRNIVKRIDEWKGVCLQRIRRPPSKFREYFVTGKNWWDSIKRELMGMALWIRIFRCIDRVNPFSFSLALSVRPLCALTLSVYNPSALTKRGALWNIQFLTELELATTHRQHVLLEIIRDLFDGTVHYANTRRQSLINSGTITNSDELQKYILALNSSLNVAEWLKQEIESKRRKRYGPLSKAIARKLRGELHRITGSQSMEGSSPTLSAADRVITENGNMRPHDTPQKDRNDSASDRGNAFCDDEVVNRMETENTQNLQPGGR